MITIYYIDIKSDGRLTHLCTIRKKVRRILSMLKYTVAMEHDIQDDFQLKEKC